MKVWTNEELEELRMEGAEIEVETPRRNVSLEGMDLVVSELKKISEANQLIAQKRHDDLVAAVNRLADGSGIDLMPLIDAMRTAMQPPEKVSYTHEIERNASRGGMITKIISTPVKGEVH
jgi:CHASE3 domain sensor protein